MTHDRLCQMWSLHNTLYAPRLFLPSIEPHTFGMDIQASQAGRAYRSRGEDINSKMAERRMRTIVKVAIAVIATAGATVCAVQLVRYINESRARRPKSTKKQDKSCRATRKAHTRSPPESENDDFQVEENSLDGCGVEDVQESISVSKGSEVGQTRETNNKSNNEQSSPAPRLVKFELLEENERVEASSFMPPSMKKEGDVRPRKWGLAELVSHENEGSAIIIGGGNFAEVAVTTLDSGRKIAVKSILRTMPDTDFCQDGLIAGELTCLSLCAGHPNVVDFYGYIETTLRVHLMMPLVPTDLATLLEVGSMADDMAKGYVRQITSALEYLHGKGVVHRDIKPANVLVAEDMSILLADFGISAMIPQGQTHLHDMCGTKSYMSPEQLGDEDTVAYGSKIDMWALGVLTYEVLTGHTPFRPRSTTVEGKMGDEAKMSGTGVSGHKHSINIDIEIVDKEDAKERQNIVAGNVIFGEEFDGKKSRDFVSKLLERDVSARMSAVEAAEHLWLGGPAEANVLRQQILATVKAREDETKAEKAKLFWGRPRARVVKRVAVEPNAKVADGVDAGEMVDSHEKRRSDTDGRDESCGKRGA